MQDKQFFQKDGFQLQEKAGYWDLRNDKNELYFCDSYNELINSALIGLSSMPFVSRAIPDTIQIIWQIIGPDCRVRL